MTARPKRLVFWGTLVALIGVGLVYAFLPRAIAVDTVEVTRKPLLVTITDEGETRVHDIFVLSAPVTGHLRRINLHVGDPVVASDTVVAEIEPIDPAFLDPRSEAQARTDIQAAEAAEALVRAEVSQAHAELQFARREYDRAKALHQEKMISQRDRDQAERDFRIRRAAHATAVARLEVRTFELAHARAALLSPTETLAKHGTCNCIVIRSPVNGRILRLLQQSEGVVDASTPLLEIGNPRDLEIVVDLLSSDAVKVEPGQQVLIKRWGGDVTLTGQVRLIEPFGYTKTSALGIDEQRVNVIIDLTSPAQDWERLAHGYQVEVDIVLSRNDNALSIPLLALFRDGERWAAFVNDDGRAEFRHLEIGRKNRLSAEVLNGITAGERVILHPNKQVAPGVRITAR